jgi:hypothetical protein
LQICEFLAKTRNGKQPPIRVDDCEVFEMSESKAKQLYFQDRTFGLAEAAMSMVAPVRTLRMTAFVAFTYIASLSGVMAAPPEDADAYLAPWFNSLSALDGTPCCAMADCRRTTSRLSADGYEVLIDDSWVAVPWDRLVQTAYNPTGQAVVCCAPRTKIILCFVRPPDT